jgi:MraZ protein
MGEAWYDVGESGEGWWPFPRLPRPLCAVNIAQGGAAVGGTEKGMVFRGTYEYSMDDRGRVPIPARYRHLFSDGLKLTLSPDGCVEVWTNEGFESMEARVMAEPATTLRGRRLRRGFSVRSWDAELDRQGRILIPQYLREKAQLEGNVIVAGRIECLEIWNPKRWEEEMAQVEATYREELESLR